jgi:transcriptional regulator with XRE-family HTH domain
MSKELQLTNALEGLSTIADSIDPLLLEFDDFMVDLAIALRELRKAAGLSQKEAAQKCGFTQAMVSKMESGDYNPSIEKLWMYVRKLDGNIDVPCFLKRDARGYKFEMNYREDVYTEPKDLSKIKYVYSSMEHWMAAQ